jgi:hypothetical protein
MIQDIDDNLFCFSFFGFKKKFVWSFRVLLVCCENLLHLFWRWQLTMLQTRRTWIDNVNNKSLFQCLWKKFKIIYFNICEKSQSISECLFFWFTCCNGGWQFVKQRKLKAIKISQWKSIMVPTNNNDVNVSSKFNWETRHHLLQFQWGIIDLKKCYDTIWQ